MVFETCQTENRKEVESLGKAGSYKINISRYVDISKWSPETPKMSGVALIEGHLHQPMVYTYDWVAA